MEKINTVHCFFEQSGTFKTQFRNLGISAYDYDIQNEYGQTDYCIDLFAEIEAAFDGKPSIFDGITSNDLIIAFFPCIYFSCLSQMSMSFTAHNNRHLAPLECGKAILERSANREKYFGYAVKMFSVALSRKIPLIMENPWSQQTFLKGNFVLPPSYIDNDRSKRGDYFQKPTAYWFLNCEPHNGYTLQPRKAKGAIINQRPSDKAGVCSKERSEISPEYAYNFICDQILGIKNKNERQLTLFE